MMDSIVIATDGSQCAVDAEELGLELAGAQDAEVTFVHVVPGLDVLPTLGFGGATSVPHEVTDADRACLARAAARAGERGLTARTELLSGEAVDEIVAYADSVEADLIVVGSRGHGAFASALLGSVSHGVLNEARRPVLVARGVKSRALAPSPA
jgi:nucleotide-binding universal stress UspA family protein